MPRSYTNSRNNPYKKYDSESIRIAIAEYESSSNISLKVIADKYKISKSVLHRHMTRVMRPHGRPKCLNDKTELYIIQYLNVCSEWGYPLDTYDLRLLIKGYLDRMGTEIKRFKNNMPGPDFIECFLKRHEDVLSKRISQNIKRARAAVSGDIIEKYFEKLQISLEDIPLSNIVNYDETNLSDDPGKKKIITKRGVKYPERVMNHSKTSTSLMIAASANGTLLPAYVVYKAAHLYDTWTKNGPRLCRYNRTASGWFDSTTFEDWVETVAIPYFEDKQGKKILIGDNLSSHLSINLIRKCKEKDIYFVFLPANSTHLTQPLDVAFFRPMKSAWRDVLFTWKKTDGRTQASIPKNCFPQLLKKLFEKLETNLISNILAGFSKTGISPLNKEKVLERLPGSTTRNETCTEEEKKAIDQTVLNLLSEMRYGNSGNIRANSKKKKINVQAGKSVREDSDYIESDTSETTSRVIENVDEGAIESDIGDIESIIEPSVIQRTKKPLTNKGKVIKEKASTSGITKRKALLENKKKINKVTSDEKKKIKQKLANEIKENNMPEIISLDQDDISQLELDLQDNLDVKSMPIIFEDIPFSDDVTDTDNNCKVITIFNEEQKENNNNLKRNNPAVKGKGVGKKSIKQEKYSENRKKEVKTFDNIDKILVKNCNDTLEEKIKKANSAEVKEDVKTYKNQKGMLNEETEKTVEAIPEKKHKLGNQNLWQENKLMVQEEKSYSLNDLEIYKMPLISEENISISENVTIENSNECEQMLITDSDNKLEESLNKKPGEIEKYKQYKNERKIFKTEKEEFTIKINPGKSSDKKIEKSRFKEWYSEEPEKKKIRIISNKLITIPTHGYGHKHSELIKSDSGQINKSMPNRKCQRYYRNDTEIFQDLTED